MKWIKHGLIFGKSEASKYGIYNTQVPYAYKTEDRIRIYFGARKENSSSAGIYYFEVDALEPNRIIYIHDEPVLSNGSLGAFDQDGVLPVCVKKGGDELLIYYGGFTKTVTHPHTCMMGLAKSKDNGKTFTRISEGPILPISRFDPFLIGSADIIYHEGLWHMIYTSGTKWSIINQVAEISYTLKYAFSEDGIDWTTNNKIIFSQENEFDAYAKPAIFKYKDMFVMYFSKRQIINYRERGESSYAFGYATSKDLIHWDRNDQLAGIKTSSEGWDSEMICYPNILEVNSKFLMFYNGNDFGKSGIGLAELENI